MSATKSIIRLAFPALALVWGACAWAADEPPPANEYVEGLRACQAIAEPGARLACYDAAAGRMVAAAEQGEVRVVDREDLERTRRRLFGFALPDLGLFGGKDGGEDEELDMLESTITGVSRTGDDAWLITIEEGSVWEIRNAPMRFSRPKPGDKVVFKRAAMGSYFIRVGGQLGVKGTRLR